MSSNEAKTFKSRFLTVRFTSLSAVVSSTLRPPSLCCELELQIGALTGGVQTLKKKKCICLSKAQSAASGERVAQVDRTSDGCFSSELMFNHESA